MYAAVGSACNTLREAQGMMVPIAIIFVVPLAGWVYFVQHPNGLLATVLSFFPPVTPMIMLLRLAVSRDVPVWQIVALGAVAGGIGAGHDVGGGKDIPHGSVDYGKPPKLRR